MSEDNKDEKKSKKHRISEYRYSTWVPLVWIFLGIGIYQLSHFIIILRFRDQQLWEQVLETTGFTEINFYIGLILLISSLIIICIGGWVYFMKEKLPKKD